jgi:hypothetical protein
VLSSRVLVPVVNRAIATRWPAQPELSREAEQRYRQEMLALNEKYFPSGRVMSRKLTLPLDQIILVLGLWMLAKHEARRITKPCAPNGDPAPPPGSSNVTAGSRR